jgi:hypothetical protein
MALMLLPTAEASGPLQLQIIPRTNGFLELVELGVLNVEVTLDELLEPQALRPIDAATSANENSACQRARRLRKTKVTLLLWVCGCRDAPSVRPGYRFDSAPRRWTSSRRFTPGLVPPGGEREARREVKLALPII